MLNTRFSTCVAPCQVTGTVRKPLQSLRAEIWSWLQKQLRLALPCPQESPVPPAEVQRLAASWPRACPMMTHGQQPIKPKQTGAKRGPAWHIDPPIWGLLVPLISSDQKCGLDRVERLRPCHIVRFGATKAPQQQTKSAAKARSPGTNPSCLS